MDLLEYEAKELFREMGIPVLPSQRLDHPKDLKGLTIPYPVVLKSQVHMGGRGQVGGVKCVENTIDAIATAQTIFNLPVMGEYPKVLLAEAKYNADREFYLAVTLNRSVRRPILLGSQQGGLEVQKSLHKIQHVIVEQQFSPYYARRLALKMGLQGALIGAVSAVIEKMYQLFVQNDLDLVEINPLGVSAGGDVMALDGKVSVNDDALARHPQLVSRMTKLDNQPLEGEPSAVVEIDPEGQIGIVCNGAGLTMATMDLVYQAGGKAGSFLNIDGETRWDSSPTLLKQRLEQGLEQMIQSQRIRVVLVNLISNLVSCDEVAEVIAGFLNRRVPTLHTLSDIRPDTLIAQATKTPWLVVRLVGSRCDRAREYLATAQMPLVESLDEAVNLVVSRVQ
ncbi:MAG: succinate--CoA ligase subunit beta [Leptolyngbyaceae cyanobacterium RU_5_1]|nr:succinate--CoA ligase subunit beta [Leptolyngbyaceae cyanobacterium RU_5_1]